jgi:hypothetical protein
MPSGFVWLAPKSLAGAYRVCTVGGTVGTRGLTLDVIRGFIRELLAVRLGIHHRYTASASLLALVFGRSISRCTMGPELTRSRRNMSTHYADAASFVCAPANSAKP